MDRFIRYGDMFDFVAGLEEVEKKLASLDSDGEADRAVGLYEAFLACCYEKIDECDDSGGYLGMFWDRLFRGWVKARQAAGRPAAETVQQILKWKESDDYGFCYDIEKDVAKVLDADAYEMFVAHFQKAVEDGLAGLQGPEPVAIFDYNNSIRLPAMVKAVRTDHARKYGFMPGFERIAAGESLDGPSFVERAKSRWARQMGEEGSGSI